MQKFKPTFYVKDLVNQKEAELANLSQSRLLNSKMMQYEDLISENRELVDSEIFDAGFPKKETNLIKSKKIDLTTILANSHKNQLINNLNSKNFIEINKLIQKKSKSPAKSPVKFQKHIYGLRKSCKSPVFKSPVKNNDVQNLTFSPFLNKKSLIIACLIKKKTNEAKSNEKTNNFPKEIKNINKLPSDFFNNEKAITTDDIKKSDSEQYNLSKNDFFISNKELKIKSIPEFSFKPKINKKSRILDQKRSKTPEISREEIMQIEFKEKQKRFKELRNQHLDKSLEIEKSECTFKPKILNQNGMNISSVSVVDRLIFWHKKNKNKLDKKIEEKSFLEDEKMEDLSKSKVKIENEEDLSFISKSSVRKSIAKFLYRNEVAKSMKSQKQILKSKYCSLRPNIEY